MKYGVTFPVTHLSGLAPGIPPSDQLVFAKTLKKGVFNSLWCRRHFIPSNPKTTPQIDWRGALKLAASLWKNAFSESVDTWNNEVATRYNQIYGAHANGFELWMKTAMFDIFDSATGYLKVNPPTSITFWEDWMNITAALDVIPVLDTPVLTWDDDNLTVTCAITNYAAFSGLKPRLLSGRLQRSLTLRPSQNYGMLFLANGPAKESYSHISTQTTPAVDFTWTIAEKPGEAFATGDHMKISIDMAARDDSGGAPPNKEGKYVPLPPQEFDVVIPALE